MNSYLIGAISCLVIAFLLWKQKHPTGHDIVVPAPATKRTDLFYGYYGCGANQVAETLGHINILMDSGWIDGGARVDNLLTARLPAIIDISEYVFEKLGKTYTIRPDAEARLSFHFSLLQTAGALQYVKYLYPIDEPNNTVGDTATLSAAIALIRMVAYKFPELAGVKFAVLYAPDKPFICQASYDLVGFDDYAQKSSVLTGQYQTLKASLLPHQQTIIVPGGSYGQDPTPFINFAQSNPEVGLIMPFLWADEGGEKGIRGQAIKQAYIDAGKAVCSA